MMRYGTFWQRVAATLIDALVLLPYTVAVEWIDAGCPSLNEQRLAGTNGEASKEICPPLASEVAR